MSLIASFVIVLGVPACFAVLLYAAPIRRATKAALFASVLGGLALLLYLPTYTLADVGVPGLIGLVGLTWIVSFLLAPLPLGVWRLGRLGLQASRR
jgi:hypothetical protein